MGQGRTSVALGGAMPMERNVLQQSLFWVTLIITMMMAWPTRIVGLSHFLRHGQRPSSVIIGSQGCKEMFGQMAVILGKITIALTLRLGKSAFGCSAERLLFEYIA